MYPRQAFSQQDSLAHREIPFNCFLCGENEVGNLARCETFLVRSGAALSRVDIEAILLTLVAYL